MESTAKKRGLFILGVGICFLVAAVSILVEHLIPGELLGAVDNTPLVITNVPQEITDKEQ